MMWQDKRWQAKKKEPRTPVTLLSYCTTLECLTLDLLDDTNSYFFKPPIVAVFCYLQLKAFLVDKQAFQKGFWVKSKRSRSFPSEGNLRRAQLAEETASPKAWRGRQHGVLTLAAVPQYVPSGFLDSFSQVIPSFSIFHSLCWRESVLSPQWFHMVSIHS